MLCDLLRHARQEPSLRWEPHAGDALVTWIVASLGTRTLLVAPAISGTGGVPGSSSSVGSSRLGELVGHLVALAAGPPQGQQNLDVLTEQVGARDILIVCAHCLTECLYCTLMTLLLMFWACKNLLAAFP